MIYLSSIHPISIYLYILCAHCRSFGWTRTSHASWANTVAMAWSWAEEAERSQRSPRKRWKWYGRHVRRTRWDFWSDWSVMWHDLWRVEDVEGQSPAQIMCWSILRLIWSLNLWPEKRYSSCPSLTPQKMVMERRLCHRVMPRNGWFQILNILHWISRCILYE